MARPDLRDAGELLRPAVDASIDALTLAPQHQAAVKLAQTYASLIDGAHHEPKVYAWAVRWVGPLLLDALASLGAVPIGKAAATGPSTLPESRLAQLRRARGA